MAEPRGARFILNLYVSLFVLYLFVPLLVMAVSALDLSPGASVVTWKGFDPHRFSAFIADERLMRGLLASLLVGVVVTAASLPLGLAGALALHRLSGRTSGFLFALLVSPILVPGLVVGLSTLIFWRGFGVSGGLGLAALAQTGYIAACVMILFYVRLQSFDPTLEEAARDLGASPGLVMRRLLAPHLAPTAVTAAVVAFLLSLGDYDTTVLAIGSERTLITEIGARLGAGRTPAVDVAEGIFVAVTLAAAIGWVALRRRSGSRTPVEPEA